MLIQQVLIIAVLILIFCVLLFLFLRIAQNRWYPYIPVVGVFIAGAVSYFPLNSDLGVFSQIVASILDSLKLFVLNIDYFATIEEVRLLMGADALLGEIVFGIVFIAAPVCTVIVLISLLSDVLMYLLLHVHTIQSKYVFSSLNEKTYNLASSMKKQGKSGLYIFCNVPKDTRETNLYYRKAKSKNFLLIEQPILRIPPSRKRKSLYFVVSDDSSANLDLTLRLMSSLKNYPNVKIFVTSNEFEDEPLLDSKKTSLKGCEFDIRQINENQLMAYELLKNNPLYNVITKECREVSMLIIGGGYVGLEVLKNSIWCSRSTNYDFKATVVDIDIERSEGIFTRMCPALDKTKYKITFHPENINAETDKLLKFIDASNEKFNYIVVATDHDEINIKAVLDLRAYFMRNGLPVHLSVVVRDKQKYDLINLLGGENHDEFVSSKTIEDSPLYSWYKKIETYFYQKKQGQTENTEKPTEQIRNSNVFLFPFGCTVPMYNYDTIVHSQMELLGKCINSIYDRAYLHHENKSVEITYKSSKESWKKLDLQRRRSSLAQGVFIKYLLWMNGFELLNDASGTGFTLSPDNLERYARLEHERWNAYQLNEGYYPWKFDDYNKTYLQTEEYKNKKTEDSVITKNKDKRVHLCITDWESLNELKDKVGTDFTEYDYEFVRSMPEIISGFDGELGYKYSVREIENKEGRIN